MRNFIGYFNKSVNIAVLCVKSILCTNIVRDVRVLPHVLLEEQGSPGSCRGLLQDAGLVE